MLSREAVLNLGPKQQKALQNARQKGAVIVPEEGAHAATSLALRLAGFGTPAAAEITAASASVGT